MVSQTGKSHYAMGHTHIMIICGLFNDAVNSSDNMVPNDMKIHEE
jgi:hypothetical protein